MQASPRKIIIVGAGVGGLSAAARLAHQGHQVHVFEKGATPGGRCNVLKLDGYTFDTGPTLLLMPEVLEQTFAAVHRNVGDYLELVRCDPNYRIHFRDGSNLTLSSDLTATGKELEKIEPGSFPRYLEFLAQGHRQYRVSVDQFVGKNLSGLGEYLKPSTLAQVFAIKAHKKMYPEVSRFFQDERLRAALTFQTMYLGISPYESPAVYGLLPYTELAMGIWYPKGGLHAVPRALEEIAMEDGARVHYHTPVARVLEENGRAVGVELHDGRRVLSDAVLINADLPWAYKHLLKGTSAAAPPVEKLRYTSSAFMMYLGLKRKVDGLLHHNVIFGRDYRASFDDIFQRMQVPEDPSFYVNAPAHTDATMAPEGKDALYVLVPVPHKAPHLDWAVEGPKVREKVFTRLAELGFPIHPNDIELERTFTPDDYEYSLNLERGSAFGLSHNFMQVGPLRPSNVDANIPNLFFVGASTQPGTGLPMVMLSAKLTCERIEQWAARTAPQLSGSASMEQPA